MSRTPGGTNKHWSKENKLEIIKPIIEYKKSQTEVSKELNINKGMICTWVKKYNEFGIEGLENKKKPGNPLCKYSNKKKFLSKEEQLEYENMKLRIENELLKKGYLMKGDGSIVKFTK